MAASDPALPPPLARAFARFRAALDEPGWERAPSDPARPASAAGTGDDDDVVVFRPPGRHARCWCVLSFDARADAVVARALLPLPCPPERLAATAELCMRVNRRLAFGRLELDPDTRDVGFQLAWPACMVGASIVPLVELFVTLLERHVPAIIMVMEAGVAPTLALAGIEASASRLAWQ
ncbi:MAG: YbjN domain-containing protein [Deltaproteobacteria bacterium]|nr:YbjN domain-containing protein [Deltaproteobacteria bacterium]